MEPRTQHETELELALRAVWDPLTAVSGYAWRLDEEVSRSYAGLPASVILAVTGIVSSLVALQQALLGVRAVTRAAHDGPPSMTDIAPAVEQALLTLGRTHSRVQVTIDHRFDLPRVPCDDGLMQSLLWLVLSSACDRSGAVSIRLACDDDGVIVDIEGDAGTRPPLDASADDEPLALNLARRIADLAGVDLDLRAIVPFEARVTLSLATL